MASLRDSNKLLVEALYEALAKGDAEAAAGLTGEAGHGDHFRFEPLRVVEVGKAGWVVAEGWEGEQTYSVHAWAAEDGVITRFGEYFNTWVTVREYGPTSPGAGRTSRGIRDGLAVWQSEAPVHLERSMPGLVLAI